MARLLSILHKTKKATLNLNMFTTPKHVLHILAMWNLEVKPLQLDVLPMYAIGSNQEHLRRAIKEYFYDPFMT